MAQRQVAVHLVVVAASLALAADVAGLDELGDDPLRRALGDPDLGRDVAQADPRVARDAQQHVRVVREEGPGAHAATRRAQSVSRFA